jgi:hypothetical protein
VQIDLRHCSGLRADEAQAAEEAKRQFALCDTAIALLVVLSLTGALVGASLFFRLLV